MPCAVRWKSGRWSSEPQLKRIGPGRGGVSRIISQSAAMQRLHQLVGSLAPTGVDIPDQQRNQQRQGIIARHSAKPAPAGVPVAINLQGPCRETVFESELFGQQRGGVPSPAPWQAANRAHPGTPTAGRSSSTKSSRCRSICIKLLRVLQERCVERLGSNASIPVDCRPGCRQQGRSEGAVRHRPIPGRSLLLTQYSPSDVRRRCERGARIFRR